MDESIVLITKDAMCRDYLPCYGNEYWKGKNQNLDELSNYNRRANEIIDSFSEEHSDWIECIQYNIFCWNLRLMLLLKCLSAEVNSI